MEGKKKKSGSWLYLLFKSIVTKCPAPWDSFSVLHTEGKGEQETSTVFFGTEFVQIC